MQEPIRDDEAREVRLGPDPLSAALRRDLRERVEGIIREELWAALGAEPYERTPERRGYQHSPRERTLTTAQGTTTLTVWRRWDGVTLSDGSRIRPSITTNAGTFSPRAVRSSSTPLTGRRARKPSTASRWTRAATSSCRARAACG